jgi:hypothetical protein
MWFKKKDKTKKPERAAPATKPAEKSSAPSGVAGLKFFLALLLTAGLVIGGAFGLKKLEVRVQQGKSGPVVQYVGVLLESPPDWMPAALGKDIAQSLLPARAAYADPDLLSRVQARAAKHPWIRQVVQVSRRMSDDPRLGLVTVKATFRQPVAKIKGEQGWAFVDLDGYRLDEGHVPQYISPAVGPGQGPRRCFLHKDDAPGLDEIHYIEIQGVSTPPPGVGQKWSADDLAEGLKLVTLMYARAYARQIAIVDVRNFGGRINRHEPFLRLAAHTLDGAITDIRFGQFPGLEAPCEIPTERKLKYLDEYASAHKGSLAGRNRYIDLRYDSLVISND